MKLRRGFKKESEEIAVELRTELGLAADDPICPWRLASHLEIPVYTLESVRLHEPQAVRYLLERGNKHFSAVTLFGGRFGRSRFICHNESHAPSRQRANLSHELAHAVLLHPPTLLFKCDPAIEEEANWLGPALLVTASAARKIVNERIVHTVAADHFGVSVDVIRMRVNVTGAALIARRRSAQQKPST